MEVKPGYRKTDVGVFPRDWDIESFGKLFTFSNGVNADKDAYGKGLRFVNVLEPITYSHLYGPEITGRVSLRNSRWRQQYCRQERRRPLQSHVGNRR